MIIKKFALVSLALVILIAPVLANLQDVPVGKCSISLDFGSEKISIAPSETSVTDDYSVDMTVLTDKETNSPGFVYIFNFIKSSPSGYLEKGLANAMNTLCARVSTESYKDGFIANGLFRAGGQKCWGIALPLDAKENKMSKSLVIMSDFKNETLNEQLVKTVNLNQLKCN